MSSRRVTRSSNLSPDFHGLLENLHNVSQEDTGGAPENSTLAEASKQDVDRLLGRAGARGASARVKGGPNLKPGKRGRKNVFPEGEDSLFYQRNVKNSSMPSGKSLICGAAASTLVNVKYGSSSKQDVLPPGSCQFANAKELGMANNSRDGSVLENFPDSMSKGDDCLDECSSMEDGCEWDIEPAMSAGYEQERDKPWDGEINIEVDMDTPEISERKAGKRVLRRANAKDKEFAELVHRAHLLCLIARGRLVDAACDDPVLQASLLSMVPKHMHFHEPQLISLSDLGLFVKWFQSTFQIHSDEDLKSSECEVSASEGLISQFLRALHKQRGSSEEVAALSVSLLRALGFTARFVTVLDVLSIKPDALSLEASADWDPSNADEGSFSQWLLSANLASSLGRLFSQHTPQTLSRAVTNATSTSAVSSTSLKRKRSLVERRHKEEVAGKCSGSVKKMDGDFSGCKSQRYKKLQFEESSELHDECTSEVRKMDTVLKKKGDVEFELELAMAMAATATDCKAENGANKSESKADQVYLKKAKSPPKGENIAHIQTSGSAVWSRKLGPLLHWAEVFCGGKGTGRWVHVDAGRGIVDSAEVVESAARSCKVPLRYVLAFAGSGAKDVTRRYVTLWSAVAPLRASNDWWNATLAPLKELEAAQTCEALKQEEATISRDSKKDAVENFCVASSSKVGSLSRKLWASDRSSLEDMELDKRASTEPLPKNQQAYKNHHLYVLERWLTKYQALHPKGPILGYCGGRPVYPRTCVQELHTAERWLREGLKVKAQELPAKIVTNARLISKKDTDDLSVAVGEDSHKTPTTLFGRWQTEPWCPLPAVGGIVPKNERGNVELWSEKCLPPGTVHISLPRILPVAKKLEIDFAQALVGFEIRNRRSVPVFEGIVVCEEHEIILLEAYAEEEYRRNIEAEKRRKTLAVVRWCQLLRSVTTRQRLEATYQIPENDYTMSNGQAQTLTSSEKTQVVFHEDDNIKSQHIAHEHMYPEEDQSYNEQTGLRTKVCPCGFTLTVEEM